MKSNAAQNNQSMEITMQKNRYFPLSLVAAAIFSGCSTLPPENTALMEARSSYNSARANAQVTNLAPIELQEAGETLNKADSALSKGESPAMVNQLAYLAKQKVAIAQETAKRKMAELDVANSSVKRDQIRLEARTAEADAAKKRAILAQQTADQRAAALAEASAQSKRDQALIAARLAELEEAKKQAAIAQLAADQQAAALAEAAAKAERDQALIAARMAEVEEAKKQTAMAQLDADQRAEALAAARKQAELAQQAADQRTAALAEAEAKAEQAQALIAQQEMQLKELNAKKTERGMVITLGDVLFNTNKAQLSAGGINNVTKLADFLNKYPQRKVMIEGHTDSTGSASYNQALSERRAEAVQKALAELGIDGSRIAMRGYGESSPVANNETAAGRQLNRRVEIILSDDSGNIAPHK
jgi:outer membrane protein OmpA-like peptidoglycan-associated protein